MKEIKLTQNKVALVDDEDFDELNKFKWQCQKGGNNFYACRSLKKIDGKRPKVWMHRIILNLTDIKTHCDHKDGNGLNNQKANLRECSHKLNHRNRKNQKNSFSKYKGVSMDKEKKKFRVLIMVNGKSNHVGYFTDEIAAAKAYDEKAKELFGKFAFLNFN